MLKPQEKDAMAGLAERARSSMCFQSLLGFFFNKGIRGGPRVLLNLAAVLFAVFIFVKLLPQHMAESAFSSIPISWSSLSGQKDDGSVPGGLRIVVFGELDIGTPVGADSEGKDAQTWTQALCEQLSCGNHISMVPSADAASFSVSSNELYAQGVEKVLNETADKDGPGQDYSYLSAHYPPQWKSSDLKEQIDSFLAMPKPRNTPGETLWVFSFGLWDVFSLSALPINNAKESARRMTEDVFEQIERLYVASQDPTSIAYSDHDTAAIQQPAEPTEGEDQAHAPDQMEVKDEPAAESEPTAQSEPATKDTAKAAGSFNILIPRIVDPSLLPGWRDIRPELPVVHSKAEQLRNCATLTSFWNDGIVKALGDWVKKDDSKKESDEDEVDKDKSSDFHIDEVAAPVPTGPTRDGYAYNLADFVINQILERQMLNAHLSDGNGLGTGDLEDGYRDVSNACLQPVSRVAVAMASESEVTLNIPNVKIDHDKQVPAQPTPPAALKRDAEQEETRAEAVRHQGLAYMDTARVCEIPGDHLFYTPFALSQKAIRLIAAEMAEMIRSGESVRSKLSTRDA